MPGPHESGQPPAGDRPKERRAPSVGLEGHQPKDWQALFFNKEWPNDLSKLLEVGVSELVLGVLFWFGGLVFLHLFTYSWLFSLFFLPSPLRLRV